MWREAVVAYLKLVFGLSLECLRTATKILRIVDFLPEI
jgi:hypothetical protein